MVGSGGYLADLVATYLSPGQQSSVGLYFALIGGLAELSFLLWLLIKGAGTRAEDGTRSISGELASKV
jgi:uncharacterized protein DUF4386